MTSRESNRSSRVVVLTLLVALALAACGGDEAEDTTTTEGDSGTSEATTTTAAMEMEEITFALTNQRAIQYHPVYVAQEVGYFEEEGLDVEVVIVSGSSATVQQIIAGNVDIGNPSAPAVMQGASQGNCLKVFYSFAYQNVFGLATPESTGIESLEDLSGNTVGISEPGGGEVPLVRAILAGAGLEEGTDYELLAVGEGGPLTFQALEDGTVQAYSSSVFDVAAVEAAGMPLRQLMPDEFKYFPSTNPTVTCEYYENNKDLLARFGRAIAKATVWSEANPEAAKQITREVEPELWEDEEMAEQFWQATVEMNAMPPAISDEPLGTHYREGWETYVEFASQGTEEEGALNAEAVNLDEILTDELLGEINDFDRAEVESEAMS